MNIKELKERIEEIKYEHWALDLEAREMQCKARHKKNELNELEAILNKNTEIKVTDHALLRYLEREHGLDSERIREDLQSSILMRKIEDGVCYLGGRLKAIVVNDVIVTIIKEAE